MGQPNLSLLESLDPLLIEDNDILRRLLELVGYVSFAFHFVSMRNDRIYIGLSVVSFLCLFFIYRRETSEIRSKLTLITELLSGVIALAVLGYLMLYNHGSWYLVISYSLLICGFLFLDTIVIRKLLKDMS